MFMLFLLWFFILVPLPYPSYGFLFSTHDKISQIAIKEFLQCLYTETELSDIIDLWANIGILPPPLYLE